MTTTRNTVPCLSQELAERRRDVDAWLDRLATCTPEDRPAVELNARRVARVAAGTAAMACRAGVPVDAT